VSFVFLLCSARPVLAELVYFNTGRTLSVKGHHAEGDSLVLVLRGGGEIVCDAAIVSRFAPDEVPYPEPEAEAPPAPLAPVDAPGPYSEIIDRVAAEQDVSVKLVRAVIQVESAYNVRARSSKGAMGLMQLMPATARQYAVADPYDPASNIEAGIKHLKSLLQRLPVALALAAYNAGEAAVQRFNGIPPYPETRNYVARILALANR
jgi:soluble lytic murein transglycosylase-like protein